jgi:hypothetical protein
MPNSIINADSGVTSGTTGLVTGGGDTGILEIQTNGVTAATLDDSGNLNVVRAGARITGDFSNATVANRVAIQTNVANANTVVPVLPNGTATSALLEVYNSSDVNNAGYLQTRITDSVAQFNAAARGTGEYVPMSFVVGGAQRMRIDTDGQQSSVVPGGTTLYPEYKCRAWVNFNGTATTPTIRASGNVSSVARDATGVFTINFATAMPDADYAICNMTNSRDTVRPDGNVNIRSSSPTASPETMTSSAVRILTGYAGTSGGLQFLVTTLAFFR